MFEFSPEKEEGARQPFVIPVPFLRSHIGAGDVVKGLTDALRIPQCGGCKERQDAMNGAVEFRPMRSLWED
jgi:hypothetical protein